MTSKATRCPSCKVEVLAPAANPVFPFCSARCRTIDLGRWLGEEFRLAASSTDEDEDGDTTAGTAPPRASDA